MRAYVNTDTTVRSGLDTLAPVLTVSIPGRLIKAGMVLVDPELGTPAVEIDHRMRARRGTGEARFLAHDLDSGALTEVSVHGNAMIAVMADNPTEIKEADPVDMALRMAAARAAGEVAHADGRPAAPGVDATVRSLVFGFGVGEGAAKIFEAFSAGYRAAVDVECARILAE